MVISKIRSKFEPINTKTNKMNKNQKFVISINRELGSGGRTVGEKLAAKLGVPFYDKALIKALEEKYKLTVDEIEKLKGRNHSWWDEVSRLVSFSESWMSTMEQDATGKPDFLTTDDIYKAEKEILLGIAKSGSCVIAGRTSFFIFRDHPNHLNILIQASMESRIERLVRKRHITPEQAKKTILEVDKMRENYLTKYTGVNRYDATQYDLVIKSDGKTEDQIVDLIMLYIG